MSTWLKSRLGKSVAAGTLAVAVVGGAAFAVAGPLMGSTVPTATVQSSSAAVQAASGNTPSTSQTPAAGRAGKDGKGGEGILRRLMTRSVHASVVVKSKGGTYVTLTLDRGTIKSISSSSITILRPDGVTVTAPLTSSTKFLRSSESALAPGDKVVVVQESGATRDVVALGKRAGAKSHGTSTASIGLSTT
jgi:hypothetical protein